MGIIKKIEDDVEGIVHHITGGHDKDDPGPNEGTGDAAHWPDPAPDPDEEPSEAWATGDNPE